MIDGMMAGFAGALHPLNLLFMIIGVSLGIIVGILPGLGSVTALSILIPVTFYMNPLVAIAFLVGVNKGGTSGGAVPAILLNAPGTPEAAATALDGYPMCRKGQPVKAMKAALYSSVFGDTLSDILLILVAAPFATFALRFGPAEFTAIVLFSFTLIAGLSGHSVIKGIIAAFFGLFLSTVGLDPVDSSSRMTFDIVELYDGISLNALAIGTLALSSVIQQIFALRRNGGTAQETVSQTFDRQANKLRPSEFWSHWPTLIRSALIGSGIGMLPGLGVSLAAFLGYGSAKRASKTPEKFGTGHIEGVMATEAANSAVVGANLVPTIALGIPGNIAAALIIGAFMIHGVVPGPFMFEQHGDLIYGIFASMLICNGFHLLVGRLGINIWGYITRVPKNIVLPIVIVLCIVGVYVPTQSLFDVGLMLAFAGLGYLMRSTGFSLVCFVIGFLLGPMFETSLRQTMLMYKSDLTVLLSSPIALIFVILTVFSLWRFARRR